MKCFYFESQKNVVQQRKINNSEQKRYFNKNQVLPCECKTDKKNHENIVKTKNYDAFTAFLMVRENLEGGMKN